MSQQTSGLHAVLNTFLVKIRDCKILMLSTGDGVELLTVARDDIANETNTFDKQSLDYLVVAFAGSSPQGAKLGLGNVQHSFLWTDHGAVVHVKLDALIVSLIMEDNANLGLLDEHIAILQKLLGPFSNSNFINVTL